MQPYRAIPGYQSVSLSPLPVSTVFSVFADLASCLLALQVNSVELQLEEWRIEFQVVGDRRHARMTGKTREKSDKSQG